MLIMPPIVLFSIIITKIEKFFQIIEISHFIKINFDIMNA